MSDANACAELLCSGSRSFHAAAKVLPARVRRDATALYAFCRVADDAVDQAEGSRSAAVERLRLRLDRIYDGRPCDDAADRAFAGVVDRHAIPRALPEALLEGFAWDAEGRRYGDFAALQDYAARVAGSVGAMMALVMGASARATLARACELGVAMQLTNIARDIGEDARAGRLYLPLDWLRSAGIDPEEFLVRPRFSPALGFVVQRLLAEADFLYARSGCGIAELARDCRPGIHAARLLYRAIGHAAGARGFDPVSYRAIVPPGVKAWLVARALAASFGAPQRAPAETLPSVRYLVEAVPGPMLPARRKRAWRRADESVAWVIDLFVALEARQRA